MGCSFGMALREHGHFIIGLDKNLANLEQAKQIGALDATSLSITQSISQSQIVIIATPVDIILKILPEVLDNLPKDALVIDTGSTKMAICKRVQNHPKRGAFIAAHPMAGTEQSGPNSARANLFRGKTVAICERELSQEKSINSALEIFSQVGLEPIFLTPKQHDSTAALVSHLPQVMAYAYAGLPEFSKSGQNWGDMASSGFDSSTRLAASIPEVWLPILLQNKEFVVEKLHSFGQTIDILANSLSLNNTIPIITQMERAKSIRVGFENKQKIKSEKITINPQNNKPMETEVQVKIKEKRISQILKNSGKIIIAGPCSAETQEQVIETAKALAADGRVNYLRAGIWKPRTSPGAFEGVGAEGFQWLNQAKTITGLPIATEVGSERHIYEALKHGVDMLWIGARTVSSPFTIQEIAEAIRGVDIPVFVKNPLSPDINLWEGAINRFIRSGVSQIGAIHRGFTQTGKSALRNQPIWNIPLILRDRMPDLPIICDPSHIAGDKNLVPAIAQRATKMGFNGLMVEVHPNPQQALSDASQQLLPSQFSSMLNRLFDISNLQNSEELLSELRLEVDMLDEQLISALGNRMKLVEHIASIKKERSLEVFQASRWENIIIKIGQLANQEGLRPTFVRKLYNNIHKESCTFQNEQMIHSVVK